MISFLQHPWLVAFGWALVHFLWQGLLVGMGAGFLLFLFRRNAGQLRYVVACTALALCPLLLLGTMLKRYEAPALRAPSAVVMSFQAQERPATPAALAKPLPVPQRLESALRPYLPALVGLWALGSLVMGLRLGGGWLQIQAWRNQARPAPEPWEAAFLALAQRMGLRRPPRLAISEALSTPLSFGLWRPIVLVPAALLTGYPPAFLEALLAHELAHVQRRDYLVNLLQSQVEVLCFFHPVVWWLSHRIRTEREQLCDDRAVQATGEPRRLALALNALDDLQPHLTALALAARGGNLMHRIQRLVKPLHTSPASFGWVAPALLALGLLSPLAAQALGDSASNHVKIPMPADLVQQIDQLAAKEGIDPNLLRAIAFVESRFNPKAKSPLGAQGILQVMPATALKFGAQDLQDRDQVAAAGARFLRHLLDRYPGDVAKAVAAYNGGPEAVDAGELSAETRAYVPDVMQLVQGKAITAEAPLLANRVEGRLERWPSGKYGLSLRVPPLQAVQIEVRPAEGEKTLGIAHIGSSNGQAPVEIRPKISFDAEGAQGLRIRITAPGQGLLGEISLPLASKIQVFQLELKAPQG